ncbi:MAG: hypothetical protein ACRD00_05635 [Thermoanaerobaculia bacterium]
MASRAPRLTTTALTAAAVLLVATLTLPHMPSPLALLHPPQTPYDRSRPRFVPGFVLLTEARAVVPAGASVTVTSEPPDPALDADLHHLAAALLPGRRLVPAALFGATRPDLARLADYVVVVGGTPAKPPGDRLLIRKDGSVWRRGPS